MQGQRSTIGSLPDSINFDFGSTPNNMGIDQQIYWNALRDPAESMLSEFRIPPDGDSIMGTGTQEAHNQMSRWNTGGPISTNQQNPINHDERMTQNGWSSSISREGQVNDAASAAISRNGVNLDLHSVNVANSASFFRTSNSGSTSQSHDISLGQLGQVGDLIDASGSGGFLVDEDDGRPGYSLDGRRLSCKRKNIEGNVGSSSMWQAGSSSLYVPPQPDPENPRLRLSMGGAPPPPTMGIGGGSSQRNYRVRTNPINPQDSLPNNLTPLIHQPLRFTPINPSPNPTPPPIHVDSTDPEGHHPVVLRLPGVRRNVQSVRWSAGSSSRAEMDPPLHEDLNPRPMPRNISEHPMFMPSVEVRNTSPHNATGLHPSGGGSGSSRHIGSSSRSSSGPTWGSSHRHSSQSQYSRRLSEYVRRSLLSSAGSEGGSTSSAQRSAPASQEGALPAPGGGAQGHNPTFSRSAMWMDRRGGDSVGGIPSSLRALAAAGGEGRSRLVSEHIRNVLDIMRRGEGLRLEDVMILDPSVLFGMADIHDQHRDMRLDIDNMSYEELLALEERIGSVSTGLSEETILACLKRRKYLSVMRVDQTNTEPCCVCQEEYKNGEDMGMLDCGHDFHADCIKQWLGQKNSCPICKTTGLST